MNAQEILISLIKNGVQLWTEDGKLHHRALKQTAILSELRPHIAEYRAEIIKLLYPKNKFSAVSFAQERLWFLDQLEGGSATYNIPAALRLKGSLDTNALEKALAGIVRRHEILRTVFVTIGDEPVQQIISNPAFSLPVTDLSALATDLQTEQVRHLIDQEAEHPFDLAQGPLLRASLLRLSEQEHILLLNMHHIISDEWSTGIFMDELTTLYSAFLADPNAIPLPELPFQYADFAIWQRAWLHGQNLEKQLSYWKNQLADAPALLELPTDYPRPAIQTFHGKTIGFELDPQLAQAVKALSRQHNTTLFMTLYAAFAILLSRYSRQDDIVLGSPIANRNRAEIEPLIGFFVNTLALRADLSGNPTFGELLQQAQRTTLDAYAHQDLPFEKLVAELHPERSLSYPPIFQIMFDLQNAPDEGLHMPGLEISYLDFENVIAKFDLTLSMADTGRGLAGAFEYNTDLFDETTIRRMIAHWQILLAGIVSNPNERVASLPILTEAERQQIVVKWNNVPNFGRSSVQNGESEGGCIHHLFEEQAERTPDNIAVSFEAQSITYRELNQRANQLAHHLQKLGVRPETPVGICLERSLELIVGIMSVLKAGGAYVPLDPKLPAERLTGILEDTNIGFLLSQQSLADTFQAYIGHCIYLDVSQTPASQAISTNPSSQARPENSVYIIYTSGSTGKPKGVVVSHRNLVNAYYGWNETYQLQTKVSVHLQMANFSFDVFSGDFVRALCSGGKLVLCPADFLLMPSQLYKLMCTEKVDIAEFVPAVFRNLIEYLAETGQRLGFMRILIVASDKWYVEEYKKIISFCGPDTQVINSYGLTETTIDSTYFISTTMGNQPDLDLTPQRLVPIGKPFPNIVVYILDKNQQLVPIGITGELYIGGAGVASGYLNLPSLTAEKFIPNPFAAEAATVDGRPSTVHRLYRTGDLARWLPDGNIEFLGRMDYQVKVRGFRIELGEIEAVLGQHPDVRESVVLAWEDTPDHKRLVAYLVTHETKTIETGELRAYLKAKLPEYMLPSAFVFLDALPLTPNGKLDRKALPAPDTNLAASGYVVAPQTPTEEILADIWAEVLKLEKVGIHDNFFELGGHSLLATQVISRLRKAFRVDLPVRSLFESPTLAELAASVEAARLHQSGHEFVHILPVSRDQPLPLSFAQERLWFLDQLEGGSATYNIPSALRLKGSLDCAALEKALSGIIQRHEVLRTVFVTVGDEPVQQIIPNPAFSLPITDLSTLKPDQQTSQVRQLIAQDAEQPFDLAQGPLLRASLLRLSEQEHILLLNMHHIISDGWSSDILTNELTHQYLSGSVSSAPLPQLPIQYADFAAWQRTWLQGETLEKQLSYWKQELASAPALLELPTDRPHPAIQTFHGKTIGFELNPQLAQAIKTLSRQHNATLFMTLYAAFAVLLSRYSRQDDIVIGSPIANRNRAEIEALIGFFVNTLVLRADLSGNLTFSELLQQVQRTTLDAYAHQDLPFEKLVAELRPERTLSYAPLFQVMFVMQNAPDDGLHIPGLEISYADFENTIAKFDLTLSMAETGLGLAGAFEYNTDLFDEATIRRMIAHWQTLLNGIVSNPSEKIASLPILTEAERQQILVEWNNTCADYPDDRGIHQLFEEQVERTPNNIAVTFEGQSLTYRELNQRANQLAHYLQKHGVGPDALVGLCMERSLEMIVSTLGILKADSAYLPIDPNYPQARIEFMLNDADVRIVLTQSHLRQSLPANLENVLCLDTDWPGIASQSSENLPKYSAPDHLAYAMYTSGTTGIPKAVCVTHRNVTRLVMETNYARFSAQETFLQFAPISFDASTLEIWGALLHGAKLVIAPPHILSLAELGETIQKHQVSFLWLTAALFAQMVDDHLESLKGVRQLLAGGDVLSPTHVRKLALAAPGCQIINGYGPTENTTFTACFPVTTDSLTRASLPIGRAISNTQIYLLNQHLQPVPVGIPGELYTSGEGLARGYLNRPDLTAERFVPNPFGVEPGGRMYRTGDLARWLPDGNIEYLGRLDQQVKIRGFRIELGEIEAVLNQHPDVRESVLLAREDTPGEKRLVAYLVADKTIETSELHAHLKTKLPDYMLPSAFVFLDALPITPNGKLDRKALPAPNTSLLTSRYVAPHTPTEEILANIWAEVLKLDKVGIHDNFFELGGHSLLAVTLIERIRRAGFHAQVRALFQSPTIRELAKQLTGESRAVVIPPNLIPDGCAQITREMLPLVSLTAQEIELVVSSVAGGAVNVQDIYPLAPLQEGILFHHIMAEKGDPYLLKMVYSFDSRERLENYLAALQAVVDRHDILRTGIVWEGLEQPVQVVWRKAPIAVEYLELAPAQGDIAQQLQDRFDPRDYRLDVAQAPLIRLFATEDKQHQRWVMLELSHHLIGDHETMRFMDADVETYLLGELQDLAAPVPFRNYVAQVRLGISQAEHEAFFRNMLGDVDEPTAPFGLIDVLGDGSSILEAWRQVDSDLAKRLRKTARDLGVTPANLFHLAWALVLAKVSGRDDVVFGTVLFGRLQGEEDAGQVFGMTINTLPVRIQLGADSAVEAVRKTHETLTQLIHHEYASLALAQRCSGVAAPAPLFSALLNYRHSEMMAQPDSKGQERAAKAWQGIQILAGEERTNYPFGVSVDDLGENGFSLVVQVAASVDPNRVCEFIHHALERLIETLENRPETRLCRLDILPEAERQQIVVEWNNTALLGSEGGCIHQLFEEQVERTPDNIAVSFEGQSLTYQGLNQRANQLAHSLQKHGVGPDVLVGICMERSLEMIIGLFGILKAGGAYVPLDPTYPVDRLTAIAQDSQIKFVISQPTLQNSLPRLNNLQTVFLDDRLDSEFVTNPVSQTQSQNLAYVLFTSGTTGRPKGVALQHSSIAALIHWVKQTFSNEELSNILASTSIGFDLSVLEIFGALCNGGQIILVENILRLLSDISYQPSLINTVPSAITELVKLNKIPSSVQTIVLAGEALSTHLVDELYTFPNIQRVVDGYGPTETTYSTYCERKKSAKASIGRPLPSWTTYILDKQGFPVPAGIAGELFIGGAGVARGYLNRPDLTAEKFIPNPFALPPIGEVPNGGAGGRLYCTGDLARWLPDGNIEYLGRLDHQVKIRGFRIELGEIEALLNQHPDVRECVVLAREDTPNNKRLVAYLVTDKTIETGELRTHLKTKLPEYMLPSAFVFLDALPLTPNGKLDRKALPAPDISLVTRGYIAPRTPTEEILASIWAEVLKLDKVGIHDNFFELGGHSLLATQVISRLRNAFQVDLPVRSLFESPTLAELAASIEAARLHQSGREFVQILPVSRDVPLPLSFAQERLWFLDQLEGSSATYNIPAALRLKGSLDPDTLEQALAEIIRRHEVLRTVFVTIGDEPVQQVIPNPIFSLPITDLSFLGDDAQAEQVRHLIAQDAGQPFDLAQGPLLRASLLKLSEQEHILLLNMHHIVSDGWSIGILTNELTHLHHSGSASSAPLPELPIQYADFAAWQREWLQGETLEKQLSYWKQQLAGAPALLELPTDRPRPAIQTFHGKTIGFELEPQLTQAIKALSRQHNATLFMTLYAAFAVLLSLHSRQDEVVIGSPIANRNRAEIEPLVGFFVNTLALRADLSADPTFSELLRQVQRTTLDAYAHQDLPFEKLVAELQPNRTLSYSPIFQVMFVLQNAPDEGLHMPGLEISYEDFENAIAKFDLTLSMAETAHGLVGSFEFNTDLFDETTIRRMIAHWQTLLNGIVSSPNEKVASLPLLTGAEWQQIVVEWNNPPPILGEVQSEVGERTRGCIHQLFEEQVERTPDHVAVSFEDQSLTYRELNQRANQLAHSLQKHGVGPDTIIGICIERSLEMVAGLLGIWKAGGAYLPLDPGYPGERLAYMMEDSGATILLTQTHLQKELPTHGNLVISLDADWLDIGVQQTENLNTSSTAGNLAYVIYTSGSTGNPKGVMVAHRGLVNVSIAQQKEFCIRPTDRILQLASLNFDASIFEIVMALCSGATLFLEKQKTLLPGPDFAQLLKEREITAITITPTALAATPVINLPALRLISVAGEACPAELVSQWAGGRQFFNLYGPTEVTIWSTAAQCSPDLGSLPPIGQPISNLQVYILNGNLHPAPIGVAGELCISGDGLARGYLNRPDLTAEKFIPNPFPPGGGRLYRTGDLARWLPDGNIEFLGRIDQQVKIRGFRIELGEIEAALNQHPDVRECVALAREDTPGEKRLVAYLVTDKSIETGELRAHLKTKLPEYMLPSAFVCLDTLPLTPNGKLDRKALPAPDTNLLTSGYVAPRTPTEEILASIWAEVLKLDKVGTHDNFFELGGHSLLATQVISRLRKAFQVDLPVRSLFETPTLAELAASIEAARLHQSGHEFVQILPVSRDVPLPLSFAQERLWFLDQLEGGSATYNIPFALRLQGSINTNLLEKTISEIVRRHEVLRTIFVTIGDEPVQKIIPNPVFSLPVTDLSSLIGDDAQTKQARHLIAQEAEQPFDLTQGPLLRASLLRLSKQEHILLFTMHHIVSDGWSIGILTNELTYLYLSGSVGSMPLPELPIQYADFAAWQRGWLQGENLERQLAYWKQQLAGAPTLLELPTDRPRPAIQTFHGKTIAFEFDPQLARAIKTLSRQHNATLFMTLYATFAVLLSRYSRQDEVVIGSPIANRNRAEIEPLIGFFVNTLALRADLSADPTFSELLRQVQRTTLDAYAHQDLPFEKLVAELHPERSLSYPPIFQVMFTLQNTPDEALYMPGLDISYQDFETTIAKFDLTLSMAETGQGLAGAFEYNTDLFDEATIRRMIAHWQTLLNGIVSSPNEKVTSLPILTEAERQQILVEWNNTRADYPDDRGIHQLFEEQVERTPNNIAVTFESQYLTYRELNQRANQLAHHLQKHGVGPDVLVGICMERSLEMLVGLLGILKAGGAYVPLDPEYPKERLAYMLQDAHTPILLTQDFLRNELPVHQAQMICVDTEWAQIAVESGANLAVNSMPENLAYVIYTSGSTGKPKGAMVSHSGLVNYLIWCKQAYPLNDGNGAPVHSSISFDLTITGLFAPLIVGQPVHMLAEHLSAETLSIALKDETDFSLIKITPAHLKLLGEQLSWEQAKGRTRAFIIGGENLQPSHINFWQTNAPDTLLINEYGPTETVVGCCIYVVQPGESFDSAVPIGQPINNTSLYILDVSLQPVPIGIAGELYIGGEGVARGYLNRPDLTAERFVPNPFAPPPVGEVPDRGAGGGRLYRTGDLARWLPDGNIEYLGRLDQQVKLRGFRIELGEIEAVLNQHSDVRESVVLAREDHPSDPLAGTDKRLVAYIVSHETKIIETGELRAHLKSKLPEYMMPSAFVFLETLPLTPNGKLDRKALPAPDTNLVTSGYVAPRTLTEEILASIWAEVLKLDKVGIHDNFFELGGHSLLATQVISRLQGNISLTNLFQNPTVAQLALLLEHGQKNELVRLVQFKAGKPSKAPLFLVHPAGGNVFSYLGLARYLEPDQPFYAIQALDSEHISMEHMASRYIEMVRSVQPNGPYLLGGWSLGGSIAFEMAQQLHKQGQSIDLLVLLDAYVADDEFHDHDPIVDLQAMMEDGIFDDQPITPEQIEHLKMLDFDEKINYLMDHLSPQFILPYWRNSKALRYYKHQVYPGTITLFSSVDDKLGKVDIPKHLGWDGYTQKGVIEYPVSGTHLTMVQEPNVSQLAKQLNDCLREVANRHMK